MNLTKISSALNCLLKCFFSLKSLKNLPNLTHVLLIQVDYQNSSQQIWEYCQLLPTEIFSTIFSTIFATKKISGKCTFFLLIFLYFYFVVESSKPILIESENKILYFSTQSCDTLCCLALEVFF